MKLTTERRRELIDLESKAIATLYGIADELNSERMEERVSRVSEAFYYRLSQDKNLKHDRIDIEAEMDDDSGEENDILDMEVEI